MENAHIKIERIWSMPNKWTFTIKPIKKLLNKEITGKEWFDPFAGNNSPWDKIAEILKNKS